jgi:hypothetical protein
MYENNETSSRAQVECPSIRPDQIEWTRGLLLTNRLDLLDARSFVLRACVVERSRSAGGGVVFTVAAPCGCETRSGRFVEAVDGMLRHMRAIASEFERDAGRSAA